MSLSVEVIFFRCPLFSQIRASLSETFPSIWDSFIFSDIQPLKMYVQRRSLSLYSSSASHWLFPVAMVTISWCSSASFAVDVTTFGFTTLQIRGIRRQEKYQLKSQPGTAGSSNICLRYSETNLPRLCPALNTRKHPMVSFFQEQRQTRHS